MITAPAQVAPGDLVVLTSSGSVGQARTWSIVGGDPSRFLPVNDDRDAVFASGTPGRYFFTLAVADNTNDALTISVAVHELTIGNPPDPVEPDKPDPIDPDKPDPQPPADFDDLADIIRQGAEKIDADSREAEAKLIAAAFADHANRIGEFDSIAALTLSTSRAYAAALGPAAFDPWKTNVFDPLAEALRRKRDAGELDQVSKFAPAWRAIATAFEGVGR